MRAVPREIASGLPREMARKSVRGLDVHEMGHELTKMIEYLARMLVDFPDQVQVVEVQGENTTVIELKVAKEDLGKIIGKQGRTAKALRTVLNGASTKLKRRTVLEIVEEMIE